MDNALCKVQAIRSFGHDLGKARTKPVYTSTNFKPYRKVNQFKPAGASFHRHSVSYMPTWRNITCPSEISPYMMKNPTNQDLHKVDRKINLSQTGFMSASTGKLNIANFKGNTYKETVAPFYTKCKRSRTKLTYQGSTQESDTAAAKPISKYASIFNGPSTIEVVSDPMNQTQPVFSSDVRKKRSWLNQFISQDDLRQKPIFQNTVGQFVNNNNFKDATNAQTIVQETQFQNMTLTDFDRYRRDVSPDASKVEFQHFLKRKYSEKSLYDSNIGHGLSHHYKVLAYKEKELNQRALALETFSQQNRVHDEFHKHNGIKKAVTAITKIRHSPDQYDQRRSPRKFTAITTYTKEMKDSRVFMPDGRMRVIRPNIHP